jgi:hypothetical protein
MGAAMRKRETEQREVEQTLFGPVCEEEAWVEESGAAGGAGRR